MTKQELKLRQYITEVAIVELPLIHLLTALMIRYDNQIPENVTLGDIINFYINKIENFPEKAKNDTQDNFDKVYAEFENLILTDTKAAIEKAAEKTEEAITENE
jgi:hypothetical protein